MKAFLLICLSLFSLTLQAAQRGELYEKSIEAADLMYLHEKDLSTEQKGQINRLFDLIIKTTNDPYAGRCGDSNEVFQQSFKWANSLPGPNLIKSEALGVADGMSRMSCPLLYFNIYKESYEWANQFPGPNLIRSKAMELATQIANYEQTQFFMKKSLSCMISQYKFAEGSDGLGYPSSKAIEFAESRCLK